MTPGFRDEPEFAGYDVVIVGGAIMGSSLAWWLTECDDFDGRVLVVERDPSYAKSATALTNSCIRLQYSTGLNVRISRFTAEFIGDLRERMGGDSRVPNLKVQNYGYMYLADTPEFADALRANREVQLAEGAETRLLEPDEIAAEYPFYRLDGILLGSINTKDEGFWDGGAVFDWFRRKAMENGAEYVSAEATGLGVEGGRVRSVSLSGGRSVDCGVVVNASGTRAAGVASMAGLRLPVEPRKRYTWVFSAESPLPRELPLTIDPSGVHVRQDGPTTYLAGSKGYPDTVPDPDDFSMDPSLFEDSVWPALASRIPAFERIRVVNEWAGHYDFNTFDQNAVLGPHPEVGNFLFMNGFSGHGLQQSPAMGRGMAELIVHGSFRSLDLGPFLYDRVAGNRPIPENAVI